MTLQQTMRLSLYLDTTIIGEIVKLAKRYGKTSSQIARGLIRVGSQVIDKGGIRIKGPLIGLGRPFIKIRHKRLTGRKKRFGIRLGTVESLVKQRLRQGETMSSCTIDLLHLGLIAQDPDSFELIGPIDVPRLLVTLEVPEVNTALFDNNS